MGGKSGTIGTARVAGVHKSVHGGGFILALSNCIYANISPQYIP